MAGQDRQDAAADIRQDAVADIRFGRNPNLDAWLLHFMTENNLEHLLNPLLNATSEQLRFMVDLDDDRIFVPCSDDLFQLLLEPKMPRRLLEAYGATWGGVSRLIREHISDAYLRRKVLQFCRHRFRIALASHIAIPSRLTKRLASIVLTQSGLDDPWRGYKRQCNERAARFIESALFDRLLNYCPAPEMVCSRLEDMRFVLETLELKRLFVLSTWGPLWEGEKPVTHEDLEEELSRPWEDYKVFLNLLGPQQPNATILYLPECSGGVLLDLVMVRSLLRRGHRVVMAFKDGFHFNAPAMWDSEHDKILDKALEGAHVVDQDRISKNELLKLLREHRFLIISDGTREMLNLYRVSVTFARAWKECDVVIAKGVDAHRRLIQTNHQFTRDILCFFRDPEQGFQFRFKPKSSRVRKFSEAGLVSMADKIIHFMREAKQSGKNIMFYSAVVGSVPGQTSTAIQILTTFVEYLRSRLAATVIINPAEHFEPGLDGDDLMFMWERVQRSGLIDVWRFQTDADIEKSFELMDKKVPSVWAGKDATFSTGCTKEMRIALDMQSRQPELQIIGPSPEKFFRRREYGVGKYFDSGIDYA